MTEGSAKVHWWHFNGSDVVPIKTAAWVFGALWSALIFFGGMALGSRSSHALMADHLVNGHPVLSAELHNIDQRLARIERRLDQK